ncbi:MAG TPA: TonB family protein [Myxococcota bacterium]|nr:TonB family protein [Myxococcota bacterium]
MSFCEACGTNIGFFSRKKYRDGAGEVHAYCRPCFRKLPEPGTPLYKACHAIDRARKANATTLDLSEHELQSLPSDLFQFTQLKELNLQGNQLEALPGEIGQLQALKRLDLSRNDLTALPEELWRLRALEVLNLQGNRLETISEDIGQLRALQRLDLESNRLERLPRELWQLQDLDTLALERNAIKVLPSEIGQLQKLTRLWVGYCGLETLPPEVFRLQALEDLSLSGNALGSLPPEIGHLRQLKQLYIENCGLETLPAEIGNLHAVQEMYLEGNGLQSLPPEIGQMKALINLMLDDVPLSLKLPMELFQMQSLERLSIWQDLLDAQPREVAKRVWERDLCCFNDPYSSEVPTTRRVRAKYPDEARGKGISGKCYVRFWVDEKGAPYDIWVGPCAAYWRDEVMEAASQWRFEPRKEDGQFIKTHYGVSMRFKADGEPKDDAADS